MSEVDDMLRMEITLFLVLAFVAYIYFSAEERQGLLHKTFAVLLATVLVHLVFDAITIYTVNHLDTVPRMLNDMVHRIFMGTMNLVIFLFYRYIAILVEEETGKSRRLDLVAEIFLVGAELGTFLLPIRYVATDIGNYSSGLYVVVCYVSVVFYLLLCAGLLL